MHGLRGGESGLGLRHGLGRRWGLRHVDSTADDGSILNEDSRRLHVAVDRAGTAKPHAFQANDIPRDVTENCHVPDFDVAIDPSGGADGQAAFRKPDGSLHFPVDNNVFESTESSLEPEGFSYVGCCHWTAPGGFNRGFPVE